MQEDSKIENKEGRGYKIFTITRKILLSDGDVYIPILHKMTLY